MPKLKQSKSYKACVCALVLLLAAGCAQPPGLNNSGNPLRIHDIQGCTHISPFNGRQVSGIPGVVTKVAMNGFYLQDDQPDELDCSSEAIFVFSNGSPDVLPGDRVVITGRIEEFLPGKPEDRNLTITEVNSPSVEVISHGNLLPQAVVIGSGGRQIPQTIIEDDAFVKFDPSSDGLDFYESLEAMLVRIDEGVVVGPRNEFNEVVVVSGDSLSSNAISASGALVETEEDTNPERIMLNLNQSNTSTVSIGMKLGESLTGILDYAYGNYKVNAFGKVYFSGEGELQPESTLQGSGLRIASYNVENFSRFDAPSRARKIAASLTGKLKAPDIIVLHEMLDDSGIEDNGVVSARQTIELLVNEIEAKSGIRYASLDNAPVNDQDGGITGGNIRSVLLFREDTGLSLYQDRENEFLPENPLRLGEGEPAFSGTRKPLAALFEYQEHLLLVVAVHLTSRGADSPLFGSIQPPERPEEEKRVAQADYLFKYLSRFHADHPEVNILLTGDLNDDVWSPTIQTLQGNLLLDLASQLPIGERYSYILDGNAILLDHILVSKEIVNSSSFEIVHINSGLDTTRQVSDHDPVIVQLDFSR